MHVSGHTCSYLPRLLIPSFAVYEFPLIWYLMVDRHFVLLWSNDLCGSIESLKCSNVCLVFSRVSRVWHPMSQVLSSPLSVTCVWCFVLIS